MLKIKKKTFWVSHLKVIIVVSVFEFVIQIRMIQTILTITNNYNNIKMIIIIINK